MIKLVQSDKSLLPSHTNTHIYLFTLLVLGKVVVSSTNVGLLWYRLRYNYSVTSCMCTYLHLLQFFVLLFPGILITLQHLGSLLQLTLQLTMESRINYNIATI